MPARPTGVPDPIGAEGLDQEPAELLFYSALCMSALWVYQLAREKPQGASS